MVASGDFQPYPEGDNSNNGNNSNRKGHQNNGHPQGGFYYTSYAPAASESDNDSWDLNHWISVARRRALPIASVSLAVGAAMSAKVLNQDPVYEGSFQLLVEPISKDQQKLSKLGLSSDSSGLDYATQIQVLESPQLLEPLVKQLQSQYPSLSHGSLQSRLNIHRLGETKILKVSYRDSDPGKVQQVLNQLQQHYIQYSEQQQQSSLRQGMNFVQAQLPVLQNRVDQLSEQIKKFRQRYNLIDPQQQAQQLSSRIASLVQQRQETSTQLKQAQAEFRQRQQQLGMNPQEAVAVTTLSGAPRYQQLLNRVQEIETKLATELARFTPQNPAIQALQDKRQQLIPLLRREAASVLGISPQQVSNQMLATSSPSEIRQNLTQEMVAAGNQIQSLQVRQQKLAQTEARLRQDLQQLTSLNKQYQELQRRLQVAKESLNRFLQVRENLQIEAAQSVMPWQSLSPPQGFQQPNGPNWSRQLVLILAASAVAGAGTAMLLEKLDNRCHSPEELKETTGLPLLGTIPYHQGLAKGESNREATASEPVVEGRYRVSAFTESFRFLHANLSFLSPDRPLKSLVVSSAIPGEGKTTVAFNLAKAAARMGARVLLVDADLRRPHLHVTSNVLNVWGLSNLISSDDLAISEIVQPVPDEENLYILTAGQLPPDPTKILASKKMGTTIEYLQGQYDFLVFDTPPMLGLADAKFLANYADGLVMVAGLGKTERTAIQQVLEGLKLFRTSVLGVVANGVKKHSGGAYGYYYNQYYGSDRFEVEMENQAANQ
jgi:capsular exopolysaccharide synthesis family protein